MIEVAPKLSDNAELESICMEAAEGSEKAKNRLLHILEHCNNMFAEWPQEIQVTWDSAFELFLEEIQHDPARIDLDIIYHCLRCGYDRKELRDAFSSAVRNTADTYNDTAGLIRALRVREPACPATEIAWRWACFSHLRPETYCFHEDHGVGRLRNLDDLANQVKIIFQREAGFSLEHALGKLTVLSSGSPLDRLLKKEITAEQLDLSEYNTDNISQSLYGKPTLHTPAINAFLQRAGIDSTPVTANTEISPQQKDRTSANRDDKSRKTIETARSMVELLNVLRNAEAGAWTEQQRRNTAEILYSAAPRKDQAFKFAQAIAYIRTLSTDEDFFNIISDTRETAHVWQNPDSFGKVTEKLSSTLLTSWLAATLAASGAAATAELFAALPLRMYQYVEKACAGAGVTPQTWTETMLKKCQKGQALPDNLVWLWKKGGIDHTTELQTSSLLRLLNQNPAGAFINGHKELKRLLLENESFQQFLLGRGEPQAVKRFIRAIRHTTALDSGERQSLLVRVVRLYPETKSLVEHRRQPTVKHEVPALTSIRSYEQRRRELEDIIHKKIPQNTRDIAEARSHGDLRENAEYKAAKEEQQHLNRRRADLEEALHEVNPTDFGDVQTNDMVRPGSGVKMRLTSGEQREYLVLGMWDGDPENNVLSSDTPLGRKLVGCSPGDTIELPSGEKAVVEAVHPLSTEWREYLNTPDGR